MEPEPPAQFECERCGKRYRWKAELAGRKVKCPCGQVMIAPQAAPTESELYDLVDTPHTAPSAAVQPGVTPLPVSPVISYARQETIGESAVDRYFPDRVKDLYMPLALIAGGTIVEASLALFSRTGTVAGAMLGVGVYMICNTIIMLLTVMAVAKIRGINFGPYVTAIVKLCGISIGPGAAGSLASVALAWLPLGRILGWLAGFALYFAMIGALFDLDQSDTWCVVLSVFFARLLVGIVVVAVVLNAI
ncbi:MAG: hypothetical protein ACREJC_12705 [Tepidisphaeraceae bacterium]